MKTITRSFLSVFALMAMTALLTTCASPTTSRKTPTAPVVEAETGQWAKTVISGSDEGTFNSVASDAAGNAFAVGSVYGTGTYDFGNGQTVAGTSTTENLVIAKYNGAGVPQWARTVSATGSGTTSQFYGVVSDASGNSYGVGHIYGTGTYNFGNGQSATGFFSFYNGVIAKYDPAGTTQWVKTVTANGPSWSLFTGATTDAAGNIFVVGAIYGTATYDFGNGQTALGATWNYNAVIVKYNSAGVAQWVKTVVSGDTGTLLVGATTDASGNIYVVGHIVDMGTYNLGNGQTVTGAAEGQNAVLAKYNSAGAVQWARTVSSGGDESQFNGVRVDSSGNLYVAGAITGTGSYGFGNGQTAVGTSEEDNVVIVKYDSTGTAQWAKSVSSGAEMSGFSGIEIDASGIIHAVGQMGSGSHDFGNGQTVAGLTASQNAVIVQYNSNGIAQTLRLIGPGTAASNLIGITRNDSGSLFAVGSIQGTGTRTFGDGVTATGPMINDNPVIVKYN